MHKSEISISVDGDPPNASGGLPTFVPGQKVSGKVKLTLRSQKKIEAVEINFEGRCYTEVTRQINNNQPFRYKETIELFSFNKRLFEGPYTMQPTQIDWPFSFTFPETSNYSRDAHPSFVSGPQPLPPTLEVHVANPKPLKGEIYYSLTAKMNPQSFIGSKESVLPLVCMPLSNFPLPHPEPQDIRLGVESWSSTSLLPEKPSLKQKMNRVLSNDPALKIPSINFEATAYLPHTASIWQHMTAGVSLLYLKKAPTDPEKVSLVLEEANLLLEQHIKVRVKGPLEGFSDNGSQVLAARRFRPGSILPLDNSISSFTDSLKLADMTEDVYRLAPTFSSYTVNLSYVLKIIVTIVHPDTGHRFKIEAKTPFTLLPTENPRPPSFTRYSAEVVPNYTEDVALPAYEGDSNSSTHQQSLPGYHTVFDGDRKDG